MSQRDSEAQRPLFSHSSSRESFSGLGSRISSVSDFSDPVSPPEQYDPQLYRITSQNFVSPQSSYGDFRTQTHTQSPREDMDVGYVRPTSASPVGEYNSAPANLPPSLRTGTPTSAVSNKRFSWGSAQGPVSPIDRPSSSNGGIAGRLRSMRSAGGRRLSRHMSIPEEDGMDLRLVENVDSFGQRSSGYRIAEDHEMEEIGPLGVDISSYAGFAGPLSPRDAAEAKTYQRLESSGHLTGGLGSGLAPEVTIRSRDLLSTPESTQVGRRMSRRGSMIGRTSTIRDLAQREANRRGKIVEVVEETPDETADIGYFAGENVPVEFNPLTNRNSTFAPKKQTYYPQPNWKPTSMRYPYLTALVVVSICLAVGQELLLQRSLKLKPTPQGGIFKFTSPQSMPTWDYFSYKYLPTMIAVIYGVLWQIADYEVKRLEPYYQLSKEGGALAAESINVDYITVFSFFRPIMAIRYKHFAVAVSSVATLCAVSLVPTLQGPSIVLEPGRDERLRNPGGEKFINVSLPWSRFLTAILGVISILGAILLYQLSTRRSGLEADVRGIAGLAAMATKSHILVDFKDLDTAPPLDIHNHLKNHRYSLRNSSLAPEEGSLSTSEKDKHHYPLSPNPHPLMMRLVAGVPFIIAMILFLALIPALLFIDPLNIVLDKIPWLLTAIAVAIKIAFQTLEQDVRMMEPFFRLSCRHAPPKVLTLDYTSMAFGYMPIRAFMNGDYLIGLIGLGTVLAEILTVCVTSFSGVTGSDFLPMNSPPPPPNGAPPPVNDNADSGEETLISFWVSLGLSVFIITYLVIVASVTYHLRRHPFLPRQPSTIASILAFVHQSKMLYDFVSVPLDDREPSSTASNRPNRPSRAPPLPTSRQSSSSSVTSALNADGGGGSGGGTKVRVLGANDADQSVLIARLEAMGKTFGLGWFTGRDGETHCGVDQEELTKGYKHTVKEDARMASKPWLGPGWDHF